MKGGLQASAKGFPSVKLTWGCRLAPNRVWVLRRVGVLAKIVSIAAETMPDYWLCKWWCLRWYLEWWQHLPQ